MFGQITDLPYLSSYRAALAHYERITPLRGTYNLRPICPTKNGRRKKHMQIVKHRDGAVACLLYETDVLTFYPNGDVAFCNGNHPTSTTHGFANAILFSGGAFSEFRNRQGHTEALLDGTHETYMMDGNDSLVLRKNNEGRYEAVNPPAQYEYYVRRKVLTAKRKPVLAFQNHCIAMSKLADPAQPQDGEGLRDRRTLFASYEWMADPAMQNWGDLIPEVLEYARSDDPYAWRSGRTWTERVEPHFKTQLIRSYISEIVKYVFADEIFERKEVSRKTFNGNDLYINHKWTIKEN